MFDNNILNKVKEALPSESSVYLVGGAVRDLLLNRENHDLDFMVAGDAQGLARLVANRMGGAYFALDDTHGAGRVVLFSDPGDKGSQRFILDFAPIQGGSLDADLRLRDFTINAIALPLSGDSKAIDPLGGLADLQSKTLRACSPTALQDDAIRVVRVVRQATALTFKIEPQTLALVRAAVPLLVNISIERRRDELFKILSGQQPVTAIRLLDTLGALPHLLPELAALKGVPQPHPHIYDVWEHTLQTTAWLETLLNYLAKPGYNPDSANSLWLGLAVLRLGRYHPQFSEQMQTCLVPERPWRSLLLLAALYHDIGKPQTGSTGADGRLHFFEHEDVGKKILAQRTSHLRLSNQEIDRMTLVVAHHMRPHHLANSPHPPTRRAIFRFFNHTGQAGVDICLLNLADLLATYGNTLPQETLVHYLDIHRTLLEAYFEKPEESVSPPRLLTGSDLIARFQIQPGPQIGRLLGKILEAQAVGEISTQAEAFALAETLLRQEIE